MTSMNWPKIPPPSVKDTIITSLELLFDHSTSPEQALTAYISSSSRADGARDGLVLYALSISYSLLKTFHQQTHQLWREKENRSEATHIIRCAISAVENAYETFKHRHNINYFAVSMPPVSREASTDVAIPAEPKHLTSPPTNDNPVATALATTQDVIRRSDSPDRAKIVEISIEDHSSEDQTPGTLHSEILSIIFSYLIRPRTSQSQVTLSICSQVNHRWYAEASRLLWAAPVVVSHRQVGDLARGLMVAQMNTGLSSNHRFVPAMKKLDLSNVRLHEAEGAFTLTRALCWRSSLSWSLKDVRIRADSIGEEIFYRLLRRNKYIETLVISEMILTGKPPKTEKYNGAPLKTLVLEFMRPQKRGAVFSDAIIHCLGPSLMYLDVTGSRATVDDNVVSSIVKQCPNPKGLWLGETDVGDNGLEALSQHCKSLKRLQLVDCQRVSDEGLRFVLSSCLDIEYIDLIGTQATPKAIELAATHLQSIKGLWYENLRGLNVNEEASLVEAVIGLVIKRGAGLRDLAICNPGLLNADCINLIAESCPNLQKLWLGNSGEALPADSLKNMMVSCSKLTTLVLPRMVPAESVQAIARDIGAKYNTRPFSLRRPDSEFGFTVSNIYD
ncbi:hypothetical protein SmJEL517_g01534 [Synchytrium microbalum]|uniref:F-box domain-containing protein n=1 Tax=Synchytrium microbalum TaxID=1806994 RepID=A0A507C570_9FUNG|nr:uncharacterized protein SmJEL517_g01534 [Synchytrium microbalum]TPX36137.1 hypothetical protein SmJEL517_g01534 [Synchytrium microbalum]